MKKHLLGIALLSVLSPALSAQNSTDTLSIQTQAATKLQEAFYAAEDFETIHGLTTTIDQAVDTFQSEINQIPASELSIFKEALNRQLIELDNQAARKFSSDVTVKTCADINYVQDRAALWNGITDDALLSHYIAAKSSKPTGLIGSFSLSSSEKMVFAIDRSLRHLSDDSANNAKIKFLNEQFIRHYYQILTVEDNEIMPSIFTGEVAERAKSLISEAQLEAALKLRQNNNTAESQQTAVMINFLLGNHEPAKDMLLNFDQIEGFFSRYLLESYLQAYDTADEINWLDVIGESNISQASSVDRVDLGDWFFTVYYAMLANGHEDMAKELLKSRLTMADENSSISREEVIYQVNDGLLASTQLDHLVKSGEIDKVNLMYEKIFASNQGDTNLIDSYFLSHHQLLYWLIQDPDKVYEHIDAMSDEDSFSERREADLLRFLMYVVTLEEQFSSSIIDEAKSAIRYFIAKRSSIDLYQGSNLRPTTFDYSSVLHDFIKLQPELFKEIYIAIIDSIDAISYLNSLDRYVYLYQYFKLAHPDLLSADFQKSYEIAFIDIVFGYDKDQFFQYEGSSLSAIPTKILQTIGSNTPDDQTDLSDKLASLNDQLFEVYGFALEDYSSMSAVKYHTALDAMESSGTTDTNNVSLDEYFQFLGTVAATEFSGEDSNAGIQAFFNRSLQEATYFYSHEYSAFLFASINRMQSYQALIKKNFQDYYQTIYDIVSEPVLSEDDHRLWVAYRFDDNRAPLTQALQIFDQNVELNDALELFINNAMEIGDIDILERVYTEYLVNPQAKIEFMLQMYDFYMSHNYTKTIVFNQSLTQAVNDLNDVYLQQYYLQQILDKSKSYFASPDLRFYKTALDKISTSEEPIELQFTSNSPIDLMPFDVATEGASGYDFLNPVFSYVEFSQSQLDTEDFEKIAQEIERIGNEVVESGQIRDFMIYITSIGYIEHLVDDDHAAFKSQIEKLYVDTVSKVINTWQSQDFILNSVAEAGSDMAESLIEISNIMFYLSQDPRFEKQSLQLAQSLTNFLDQYPTYRYVIDYDELSTIRGYNVLAANYLAEYVEPENATLNALVNHFSRTISQDQCRF